MLILKNVTIKDNKNHILIENLNYSLGNEDKVGIIGEEGNGKSTLLKAIYDTALIASYTEISGSIDTDWKRIGFFQQRLDEQWENSCIFEYLLKEKVEDTIAPEDYNRLQEFENLCKEVSFDAALFASSQPIKTLSGGEKVKLQLLKLLATHMEVLLLDEPTNDLDMETLEWLETFIKKQTIPVMFVSHDETLLERSANVILHLEQRNKKTKSCYTIYRGKYSAYVNSRSAALHKEATLAHKEQLAYKKKMSKLNDQRNAVHDALNDTVRNPSMGQLLKKKMKNIKSMEKRYEREGIAHVDTVEEAIDVFFDNAPLPITKRVVDIYIHALCIQERLLLQNVNILLKGQEKAVISGRNGSGKSVLLKSIYEQLKQRTDIRLGYMPQTYTEGFQDKDTPVQFLLEKGDKEDVTVARELLGRMKFTSEEMLYPIQELSEGQKAKLYLLHFIKKKCNVLLLDEPTRNLSPLTSPVIRQVLKDFPGCILAVSHDRKFIEEVFSIRYEIQKGQLIRKCVA